MRLIDLHKKFKPKFLNSNLDIVDFFELVGAEYDDEDFKFLRKNMRKDIDIYYAFDPYSLHIHGTRRLVMNESVDDLISILADGSDRI